MLHRWATAVPLLVTVVLACGDAPGARGGDPGDATRDAGSVAPAEPAGAPDEDTSGPASREPGTTSLSWPDTLTDSAGRQVVLPQAPRRIVSLVPAATEVVRILGAADRLVARTTYDTAADLSHLPSVGGGLGPSIELLMATDPDLVIRFAAGSDPGTPRALDRAGIPHIAVRPEQVQEVRDMIALLGRLTGRTERADSILDHQQRVLDRIRERVRDLPLRAFAFTLGGSPPWVAGPDTYVGELLELAGGRNVFADAGRPWVAVEPETFRDRNPEVVLVPEGGDLDRRLVPEDRVRRVAAEVQLPGPDLDRAALHLARALRPDVFR